MADNEPARPPEPDTAPPPIPEEMLERAKKARELSPADWVGRNLHLFPKEMLAPGYRGDGQRER
jgi:hypothetical protein